MADLKLPASLPARTPDAGVGAPRTDTVRAAQRAFFDTALAGEMAAAAPTRPSVATPRAAAPPPAREVRVAVDPAAPAPAKPLRPGSLLDIKV